METGERDDRFHTHSQTLSDTLPSTLTHTHSKTLSNTLSQHLSYTLSTVDGSRRER